MSAPRVSMHIVKEVLRLTAAGLSQRQIGRSLHLSHGVVGKYQAAAQRVGLSWPLPEELDDAALADRLGTRTDESSVTRANARRAPPDFAVIHDQLKLKGVTRLLLWEEYRAAHPDDGYSYTQFCFHYQEWQSHLKLVVPDNLRSAVSKACRYEPLLNTSYYQMLAHYGTAALPARPYKPRDKAKVEVAVQVVERWILARLRQQTFFSLQELNRAIHYLLTALNQRPFKKLPGCRCSQFEALDQPALRPLPAQAYEYAEWRKARVNIDYHIEVERHYYSVPHFLLRREVDVRLSEKTVEIFLAGNRVAVHLRSQRQGSHSTNAEHMPKAHRAHLEWTPGRLLNWALQVGPHTRDLVKHLLWNKPHPEMGYRSCLGLLNLAKRFGRERLEAACQRALQLGSPNRRSVVSLLEQGLDQLPLPETTPTQPLLIHENIRGPGYYQ